MVMVRLLEHKPSAYATGNIAQGAKTQGQSFHTAQLRFCQADSCHGHTSCSLLRQHSPPDCFKHLRELAGTPLTLQDHLVSSVVAGAVVSFVASPTELVKCRLQVQGTFEDATTRWKQWDASGRRGPQPTVYRGPWDALSQIYRHEGGVRGCCNGLGATLTRETPGIGLMFVVYEGCKTAIAKWQVRNLLHHVAGIQVATSTLCADFSKLIRLYHLGVEQVQAPECCRRVSHLVIRRPQHGLQALFVYLSF